MIRVICNDKFKVKIDDSKFRNLSEDQFNNPTVGIGTLVGGIKWDSIERLDGTAEVVTPDDILELYGREELGMCNVYLNYFESKLNETNLDLYSKIDVLNKMEAKIKFITEYLINHKDV